MLGTYSVGNSSLSLKQHIYYSLYPPITSPPEVCLTIFRIFSVGIDILALVAFCYSFISAPRSLLHLGSTAAGIRSVGIGIWLFQSAPPDPRLVRTRGKEGLTTAHSLSFGGAKTDCAREGDNRMDCKGLWPSSLDLQY